MERSSSIYPLVLLPISTSFSCAAACNFLRLMTSSITCSNLATANLRFDIKQLSVPQEVPDRASCHLLRPECLAEFMQGLGDENEVLDYMQALMVIRVSEH